MRRGGVLYDASVGAARLVRYVRLRSRSTMSERAGILVAFEFRQPVGVPCNLEGRL